MPKPVSKLEMYNMSRQQMIKEYNRYVERINKQITRIKKSKLPYKEVIQAKDLKRLRLIRKGSKLSSAEILRRYSKMLEKPTYTQKAVKQQLKKKEEVQKLLEGRKISARQYAAIEKMTKRATSESAKYYQLLRRMDSRGLISDFKLPDKWRNLSTDEVMDKMLASINKDMNAKNKQRRTADNIEDAELTMKDIEADAWKWEATTGQKRRGETAWQTLSDAEIAGLEKLFIK